MIRQLVKRIVFTVIYPLCYRMASGKKINEKKAVIVENHNDTLSDNFILIEEELKNRGFEVSIHYLMVATSGWGSIIKKSLRLISDIGDAALVFLDDSNSLFGSFDVRAETQIVQLWHACGAFKKWGFSVADKEFGDDRKALLKYNGHRNYSLVPVSGEEVCWAYREAFGLPENSPVVKPLGVSRTDMFFDETNKKMARKRIDALPIDTKDKKIIAYLPTFRGSIAKAAMPKAFDPAELIDMKDDIVVLVKNHPFVKKKMEISEECAAFCRDVSRELSVEDLLFCADVMITDYSSVLFEYSLMDKPMIFFAFDIDEFDLSRGFFYDYSDFVPGEIVTDMQKLKSEIKRCLNETDHERLAAFRAKYMSGCDGHATKRILSELLKMRDN